MKSITNFGFKLNSSVLDGLNWEAIKIDSPIPRNTKTIVCGILLLVEITAAANIISKNIGIAYSNVANNSPDLSGVRVIRLAV